MRMRSLFLMVALAIVFTFSGAVSAQTAPQVTPELIAQFETIVQDEFNYFHIPGGAVAIVQGGEVVYANGFGVRDREANLPFTPETQFRIGSTTKSMTSMLIAMLVDDGLLSWDTLVTDLLPNFTTPDPDLTARLTVADLMSMATGLESDPLLGLYWGDLNVDDLLAAIGEQTVAGALHDHYAYNNEVYASAGYAGVAAAGLELTLESYITLLHDRIFAPIGMESAVITDNRGDLSDNFSESYEWSLRGGLNDPVRAIGAPIGVLAPAGAVWTNINDMARYLITQMSGGVTPDGTRIVSADSLARTWEPGSALVGTSPATGDLYYGMGWVIASDTSIPVRWHDGGWNGYRTMMAIFPEADTGLLVFMNAANADFLYETLSLNFGQLLYGQEPSGFAEAHTQYDTVEEQIAAGAAVLPDPQVNPEEVAPLLGTYDHGWTVELRDDNTLWLTGNGRAFNLNPLPGNGGYIAANGDMLGAGVTFEVGADGGTTLVASAGTLEIRLEKVE
ncbi:MAG: serine hydrolase domain-containing protein [Anaerolineae bacterium]